MAENKVKELVDTLFQGMDGFVSSKTVVGEPIYMDGAAIIPLIEVSCGMGVGGFDQKADKHGKETSAGGMSSKMSPTAILIIQNGNTKLISIKNQDAITKLLEMVPDLIDRFTGGSRVSKTVEARAEAMADAAEDTIISEES